MVSHLEQLHSILGARNEHMSSDSGKTESPAVLAVCTGAPWFPPLTVTAPTRNLPILSVPIPDKTQVCIKYFYISIIQLLAKLSN